jgi:anti-sigma B factor antagonist
VRSSPHFRVSVEPLEGTCLIRPGGELDRSTADRLGSALDAARADGVMVLLDLSAVSFIDSAGLRVLVRSARAGDTHDWAFYIVRASRAVWRLVELSGTRSELPLVAPLLRQRQDPERDDRVVAGGPPDRQAVEDLVVSEYVG